MLRKTASLSVASTTIAFLLPILALRASTVTTVTALPAAPAAPHSVDLETKNVGATPIPEPSSVILLGGALTWCFLRGRRRPQ